MSMIPEQIEKFWTKLIAESDSGQGDGTTYFPSASGFPMNGMFNRFHCYLTNTPGVAGTNTYTVEATWDGSTWIDVTNAWFSVANFTTSKELNREDKDTIVKAWRVKRVRTADGGNTDGGTAIDGYYIRI